MVAGHSNPPMLILLLLSLWVSRGLEVTSYSYGYPNGCHAASQLYNWFSYDYSLTLLQGESCEPII